MSLRESSSASLWMSWRRSSWSLAAADLGQDVLAQPLFVSPDHGGLVAIAGAVPDAAVPSAVEPRLGERPQGRRPCGDEYASAEVDSSVLAPPQRRCLRRKGLLDPPAVTRAPDERPEPGVQSHGSPLREPQAGACLTSIPVWRWSGRFFLAGISTSPRVVQ